MDERREKSFLHTRKIWHNYPNCVRRCERDPLVPLSFSLTHTLPAWKIIWEIKDHQRNQIRTADGRAMANVVFSKIPVWGIGIVERRQGATQSPSLPEGKPRSIELPFLVEKEEEEEGGGTHAIRFHLFFLLLLLFIFSFNRTQFPAARWI